MPPPNDTNAEDRRSSVQATPLVRFSWGDPTKVRRYAGWTADVIASGNTWLSCPAIDVDYGEQTGGVNDASVFLLIRRDVEPVNFLAQARIAPVDVQIFECDPYDADATLRDVWRGRVRLATSNFTASTEVVRLEIPGHKRRLDVSLGISVSQKCPWTYGDRICGKNLGPLRQTLTITAIDGKAITMVGATFPSDKYFEHGSVKVDGDEIMIRTWSDDDPSIFVLARKPPPWWLGASATLTPGCSKTIDGLNGCRANGREEFFGGMGIALPNRHPQVEADE